MRFEPIDAVILARGLGTRLRGVLPDIPTPLAPIGDRPFLEILLRSLDRSGLIRKRRAGDRIPGGAKHAYEHWQPPAPKYAVLIGDGHFNFKNYPVAGWSAPPLHMPPNLAWVDPWQGEVDSANLLANFVGDDILPDMTISRIPVNSAQELDAIVSRTIGYEQTGFQLWQKNHLFIADNVPDPTGDFVGSSEYAIQHYLPPQATALRLYQNDFGCPSNCSGIRFAITNTLNVTGAFLMNYVGHGSTPGWSGESIFTTGSLPTFANTRLPIVLSWTCLGGYWLYPRVDYQGLSESALRSTSGSIVAAFSPTGLGVSTGHAPCKKASITRSSVTVHSV